MRFFCLWTLGWIASRTLTYPHTPIHPQRYTYIHTQIHTLFLHPACQKGCLHSHQPSLEHWRILREWEKGLINIFDILKLAVFDPVSHHFASFQDTSFFQRKTLKYLKTSRLMKSRIDALLFSNWWNEARNGWGHLWPDGWSAPSTFKPRPSTIWQPDGTYDKKPATQNTSQNTIKRNYHPLSPLPTANGQFRPNPIYQNIVKPAFVWGKDASVNHPKI